jgi:hypothetical protein
MRLLPRSRRGNWLLAGVVWCVACAGWWWVLPVVPRAVIHLPPHENRGYVDFCNDDGRSYLLWSWRWEGPDQKLQRLDLNFVECASGRSFKQIELVVEHYQRSWDNRWLVAMVAGRPGSASVSTERKNLTDSSAPLGNGADPSERHVVLIDQFSGEMRVLPELQAKLGEDCSFRFFCDAPILVARKEGLIQCGWRIPEMQPLKFPEDWTEIVAISADGRFALLFRYPSRGIPGGNCDYLLWDLESAETVATLQNAPFLEMISLTPSRCGFVGYERSLLGDGHNTGDLVCISFRGERVWAATNVSKWPMVCDGTVLPVERYNETNCHVMEFRNAETGNVVRQVFLPDKVGRVRATSPDGKTIALEAPGSMSLVDDWLYKLGLHHFARRRANRAAVVIDTESGNVIVDQPMEESDNIFGRFSGDSRRFFVEHWSEDIAYVWDIPPRKSLTWFATGAAILALPITLLAWRRTRKLRAA